MREIVLDTETTGLDPFQGHRLVEVGCVELLNRIPTGLTFHAYINPERDMPFEAFNVHGLSAEFLSQHRRFHEIVDEFKLELHCADDQVEDFVNAISKAARTGQTNAGWIYVVELITAQPIH